ncbi:MAG: YfcE family phosphodiesterase [Anaerolineae bacterium]
MKIGVIADTHIPEVIPSLPSKLREAFSNVDIILHAGDVCDLAPLHELENNFTITMAVAGEGDRPEARRYLEEKKVVEFGRRKVGLIHGHQGEEKGVLGTLRRLWRGPDYESIYRYVLNQFSDVDAIIFGHTHRPYIKTVEGVLLFNPGPASPVGNARPSVGILDIEENTIAGRIINL